ncbi:MAG: hypothetical protein OFPII_41360 [Osedax symbiont Rs1]|nr:MAG: hypothetical protein OFPII_41360 [Osedax symbiont Rs1]
MGESQENYQKGIIEEASPDALFITLNRAVFDANKDLASFLAILASIPKVILDVQDSHPTAKLYTTIGFSSDFWDFLKFSAKPKKLIKFQAIHNAKVSMPATDADMLLHIRSERHDVNYKLALTLYALLQPYLTLDEMVKGFRYLDSRDLTGFVDGTENPQGEERKSVALVADDAAAFNQGSYIHLQKYHHDLAHWQRFSLQQQEDSYGRSKQENIEYSAVDKASCAHTKRSAIKDQQGQSVEILRHSLPFGDLKHSGLLFASYAASPDNFNLILANMCQVDDQEAIDSILQVTEAVTGHAFFTPNLRWFENII